MELLDDLTSSAISSGGKLNDLVKRCQELANKLCEQHGELHADTATALVWLGHAYYELGDWHTAIAWHDRSLDISRTLFGVKSKQTVCCLNRLADSHLMMRQWEDLEAIVSEAMQSFDELPEGDRLKCGDPAFHKAMVELHRHECDSAEQILVRSCAPLAIAGITLRRRIQLDGPWIGGHLRSSEPGVSRARKTNRCRANDS